MAWPKVEAGAQVYINRALLGGTYILDACTTADDLGGKIQNFSSQVEVSFYLWRS